MSKNISLEEIKKFWPTSAPGIKNINKYVKKYKDETIVIKYGGNVLIDRNIFDSFIVICELTICKILNDINHSFFIDVLIGSRINTQ